MKIKKYTTCFCVIGVLASVALLIYGVTGPHFRSEPLVSSFTFSSSNPQSFTFNVDRTEKYMIEVHLKKVFNEEKMDSIIGDFVAGGKGGTINVVWEIKEGNKIVTKGSNIDFGYAPIFSSGYSGLTIGEFNAISGIEYILSLYVKSVNPEWDQRF